MYMQATQSTKRKNKRENFKRIDAVGESRLVDVDANFTTKPLTLLFDWNIGLSHNLFVLTDSMRPPDIWSVFTSI